MSIDTVHTPSTAHKSVTLRMGEPMYIRVDVCIYIAMGCGTSVADADSLHKERADRRLAVCNSNNTLGKDDIVLIVRSAKILETAANGTVCVQFNNREGMSFEWIQASEVCAVLHGGG